jgi:hypothetical protein
MAGALSNTITSWPPSARAIATVRPARPAPMTMIFCSLCEPGSCEIKETSPHHFDERLMAMDSMGNEVEEVRSTRRPTIFIGRLGPPYACDLQHEGHLGEAERHCHGRIDPTREVFFRVCPVAVAFRLCIRLGGGLKLARLRACPKVNSAVSALNLSSGSIKLSWQ